MTLNTAVVVPMPSAKESTAVSASPGRTFLGARHWDDDGSVQRHLRFVSEPLPLARRRPHVASGPSERTRRGLVARCTMRSAACIGTTTAVFSVIYALLVNPFP